MIKDLVTNKDLRELVNKAQDSSLTPNEATLLRSSKWSEFQLQSGCYNLFKGYGFGDNAIFVQIDNGGSSIAGIRKKKAATGTQSGFPDIIITCFKKGIDAKDPYPWGWLEKTIYVEFKKIGGKIAKNQQDWHDFLKDKDSSVYFCNNILFFEKIIMKEVEEFLK